MKAGDRLYYKRNSNYFLTFDKCYIVEDLGTEYFNIINDVYQRDIYSNNKTNKWYYKIYFYTEQEIRKMKLEKICNEGR